MDLIVRNARPGGGSPVDIGIENGRIAAIAPRLAADGPSFDAKGWLACPGLIETHIHLDKSRIIERCAPQERRTLSPILSVAPLPEQAVAEISRPVACFKNGAVPATAVVVSGGGVQLSAVVARP